MILSLKASSTNNGHGRFYHTAGTMHHSNNLTWQADKSRLDSQLLWYKHNRQEVLSRLDYRLVLYDAEALHTLTIASKRERVRQLDIATLLWTWADIARPRTTDNYTILHSIYISGWRYYMDRRLDTNMDGTHPLGAAPYLTRSWRAYGWTEASGEQNYPVYNQDFYHIGYPNLR